MCKPPATRTLLATCLRTGACTNLWFGITAEELSGARLGSKLKCARNAVVSRQRRVSKQASHATKKNCAVTQNLCFFCSSLTHMTFSLTHCWFVVVLVFSLFVLRFPLRCSLFYLCALVSLHIRCTRRRGVELQLPCRMRQQPCDYLCQHDAEREGVCYKSYKS